MANCISCGREAEEGQFFCSECLLALTPEQRREQQEEQQEELQSGLQSGLRDGQTRPEEAAAPAPEARPPRTEGGKKRAAKGDGPPQPSIDVVKASVLTPPERKRVLKPSAEAAQKKSARSRAGRAGPPREGPTAGERARAAAGKLGRGGAGLGRALKAAALKGGAWLKRLARQECTPFQKPDMVAWWIGLGASLLLLAATLFMDFLRFAWMPVSPDAFEAVFSYLKAYDLGLFGYLLIACAVLILALHALNLACSRSGRKPSLNPAFLEAVFCVAALALIPLALANNGAIVRSSTAQSLQPTLELGYAKKAVLYGSYVSLLCLVVCFGAASSILAEEKVVPYWMESLVAWVRSKAQSRKEGASGGRHERKPGGKKKERKGGKGA